MDDVDEGGMAGGSEMEGDHEGGCGQRYAEDDSPVVEDIEEEDDPDRSESSHEGLSVNSFAEECNDAVNGLLKHSSLGETNRINDAHWSRLTWLTRL